VGLLGASSSIVRYTAPVPPRLDRVAVAQAVVRRAFRDLDADGGAPQAFGWVGAHDPLATDLAPEDLFLQHHLLVGFRFDRRQIPAKLVFLERRRAENARRAELGTARLGRVLRREIKADVEGRLMIRALPTPRLFDVAWNLDSGRLYFTGRLRAAREAFEALFRETFGVAAVPMIPYVAAEHVALPAQAVQAFRAVLPTSLVPDPEPSRVPHLPLIEAEA
jgi:recombination associated protein RdgC